MDLFLKLQISNKNLQNVTISRRKGKIFFNQFNQLFNLASLLGTVGATFNDFTDNDVDDDYEDIKARNCSCGKCNLRDSIH